MYETVNLLVGLLYSGNENVKIQFKKQSPTLTSYHCVTAYLTRSSNYNASGQKENHSRARL